jgi:hypothetical protein
MNHPWLTEETTLEYKIITRLVIVPKIPSVSLDTSFSHPKSQVHLDANSDKIPSEHSNQQGATECRPVYRK